MRAIGETGAYEGAAAGWHRFDPPGGRRSPPAASDATRRRKRTLRLRHHRGGHRGGEDGGRTWRDANGAPGLDAPRHRGRGVGTGQGLEAEPGPHRRLGEPRPRRLRRPARAAARGRRRGLQRHRQDDGRRRDLDGRERGSGSALGEPRRLVDRGARARGRPLGLVRRALRPGRGARRPRRLLRHRPLPHLSHARRRPDLGPGQLRATRGRTSGRAAASTSPPRTACTGIRSTARRVFITYTDIGLFRSEDGGATWTGSSRGVPTRWRNTTYWVAFDPEVKGRVWGAFSGTHDLPRPKMWRRTDPERFQGGVGVSSDGGRTWTPSNGRDAGERDHARPPRSHQPRGRAHPLRDRLRPRRLQVHRRRPHLDAEERGPRAAASRSPGASRRADDGTLYLVVARRSERGRIGDADDGALYRSTDGAEHWTRMTLPAGTNGPNGLAVDPADPRRLYLAAWGVATPGGDTGGGIFLSTDAGATWTNVLPQSQHVYDVTIDPARSGRPLRLRLRPGRLPLGRSRRHLVAPPRLQLQVGASRRSRPRATRRRSTSRRSAGACGTARPPAIRPRSRTSSWPARARRERRTSMEIKVFPTKTEMAAAAGRQAADGLRRALHARGKAHVIAATGASQFEFLDALVKAPGIDWSRTVVLPPRRIRGRARHPSRELPPLPPGADRGAACSPGQFHFIEGDAPDPQAEAARVGVLIKATRSTSRSSGSARTGTSRSTTRPPTSRRTNRTSWSRSTRPAGGSSSARAGSRAWTTCRARAISMSIRQILEADEILCIVPDARKAQAVRDCLEGEVSPQHPASVLQRHLRTTVYLDAPAASLLTRGKEAR